MNTGTVKSANYMYFPDMPSLSLAFVGESYTARISVGGGMPPYQFSVSAGKMPDGLYLGSDGTISGTPQSGANALEYNFTVRVVDNRHYYIEKQFSIMLLYKANIYISNYLNGGETTIIIDDNTKIKARGYQTIEQTFFGGTTHWVKAEPIVQDYSDNLTRFILKQDSIRIDDKNRYVTVDYYNEYNIGLATEPSDAAASFPFDWYRMTDWYREGSTLTYDILPKTISPNTGVEYRFVNWSLPNGDHQDSIILTWNVSRPGKVTANYDTYYQLVLFSQYGGEIEGNNWYKSGEQAQWSIRPPNDVTATGILGWFGFKVKPVKYADIVIMDSYRYIDIPWVIDVPGWVGAIAIIVIGGILVLIIWPHIKNRFFL